ncbi:DoxX family protein [Flindersiella endophytica]
MATQTAVQTPANDTASTSTATGRRTAAVAGVGRDLVLLLARIGLGVVMILHAKLEWDFAGGSFSGLGGMFAQSGIPFPTLAATFNVVLEFAGGIAVIAGAALPLIGVAMAANMTGAWIFVHTSGLFAMDHNGPELVIMIGLLSLVVAVAGSGRLGVDHWIARWYRNRRASRQA